MHLLYGVQATGQGHISRARAMATALSQHDITVTWLFSGRPLEKLFDMAPFGNFLHRTGLTFTSTRGQVRPLATLINNRALDFIRDVKSLDLSTFDAVVTDYEPVTAWAAKRAGIPSIGIGHQYAFGADTPRSGDNVFTRALMHHFAPVDLPVGLHWHPYADNVLPPILDLPFLHASQQGHILVYLPFEDQETVTRLLQNLPGHRFVQYAAGLEPGQRLNVQTCPASAWNFKKHLATCSGVICNSGFELVSECLQWHKPVLTKPLAGQLEQLSNALALEQLGLAKTTYALTAYEISHWLEAPKQVTECKFPDVAAALALWLSQGAREPVSGLARRLWQKQPGSGKSTVPAPLMAAA